MSDMPESQSADLPPAKEAPQLSVVPVRYPRRPSFLGRLFRWFVVTGLAVSLGFNIVLLIVVVGLTGDGSSTPLHEHFHSGNTRATNRIAVIEIDGVLMEGMNDFAQKQIEQAAKDDRVKAVVVRVNSPGGTITASDDLHQRLCQLRDGNSAKGTKGKPLVVSMGSMAASGGYYIAMPAKVLMAERTTLTGSIGVYAAFPNVSELAGKYGVKMNVIKRGEVKYSGSIFKEMSLQERQLWQDMVDNAYNQFLAVVEEGRPQLKGKLREVVLEQTVRDENGQEKPDQAKLVRRRADGGIFTADKALEFMLIDRIGYLDDAVIEAEKLTGLGEDYKAVTYDPPQSLMGLLGVRATAPKNDELAPGKLAAGASPHLWYLAPQSDLAGILASMGASQ